MEKRKAKLVICHHVSDFRALKEIEGSNGRYIPAHTESTKNVFITQASSSLLKKELAAIGIIIDDWPSVDRVAEKFAKELCCRRDGKLALDQDFGLGLCEILE
ncbi:MAG: hypothetical protein WC441_02030 [Patescibacteria group bacterium]